MVHTGISRHLPRSRRALVALLCASVLSLADVARANRRRPAVTRAQVAWRRGSRRRSRS